MNKNKTIIKSNFFWSYKCFYLSIFPRFFQKVETKNLRLVFFRIVCFITEKKDFKVKFYGKLNLSV